MHIRHEYPPVQVSAKRARVQKKRTGPPEKWTGFLRGNGEVGWGEVNG